MTGSSVGFAAAFAAGVVSFLSPCVLPLIPGYLSFLTGFNEPGPRLEDRSPGRVLLPSLLFVAGFSLVFVALGASASLLGSFLVRYQGVLEKVAGALVLVMGFLMLGLVRVPFLYGEARFDMERSRSFGRAAALVMGMAFAFGWTPCVGPILASILTLAGSSGDVGRGALLLLVYSAGLGVPFVLTGLLYGRLRGTLRWLSAHSLVVNRVAGVLLMTVGVLMLTGSLARVSAFILRAFPFLRLG